MFKSTQRARAENNISLSPSARGRGARIGEEIAKVPKANARRITAQGKSSAGRADAMPSGTSRARYQKLEAAKPQLKAIAQKLRDQGSLTAPQSAHRRPATPTSDHLRARGPFGA